MKTIFGLLMLLCSLALTSAADDESNVFRTFIRAMSALTTNSKTRGPPAKEIEVIGASFGRTGTRSLKTALNILGYQTYHMDQALGFHEKLVVDAFQGGDKEFQIWMKDSLKHGYTATTDWPACSFYKEQMEMFPDAKVILTKRDPEKWFKSFESLMWNTGIFGARPFVFYLGHAQFFVDGFGTEKGTKGVPKCVPRQKDFEWYNPWYFPWIKIPTKMTIDKEGCIQHYKDHVAEVLRTVPKEKLLQMSISEGWEPLCKHLNRTIPDVPFPKVNSSEEFGKVRSVLAVIAYIYPFIALFMLAMIGLVVKIVLNLLPKKKLKIN